MLFWHYILVILEDSQDLSIFKFLKERSYIQRRQSHRSMFASLFDKSTAPAYASHFRMFSETPSGERRSSDMACRFQLPFLLVTPSCFLWYTKLLPFTLTHDWLDEREQVRCMRGTVAWEVCQEECFSWKELGVHKVHPQVVYRNPDHVLLCNRAMGWVVVMAFEPIVPNGSFSYSSLHPVFIEGM